MPKKTIKILGVVAILFVISCSIYVVSQDDPGQYIVALHSDTPEQVSNALDSIENDTSITFDQLQTLGARYYNKSKGGSSEVLKGDTGVWIGFVYRIANIIQKRGFTSKTVNPENSSS